MPTCSYCRLPVIVFIHGGANLTGSGSDTLCGPKFLLNEMLVLVTFNYRLGILGNNFKSVKS